MSRSQAEYDASPFRSRDEREAERASKREALLLTAVRMFNANGFHATSLDDVAAALGVSKPTIYYYLGNKDQVLLECVERGLAMLQEEAEVAKAAPGTGLNRLRAFLVRYAEIIMSDFGACVIRTGDELLSSESQKRFRMLKGLIDNAMRKLILEGMGDGSISQGDVKLVAFTLAGALNWPARWFDPARGQDATAVARSMVEILTKGLAPHID